MLTDEQKALRRQGLTATDFPAIAGFHPHRSQLDVYLEKTDPTYAPELGPNVELGELEEDVACRYYERHTGRKLERAGTYRHPVRKLMLATPDRLVAGESRLVEAKFTSLREDWGEPGTDEVPEHVRAQVQTQMDVTGREVADVIVLFVLAYKIEPAIYTVPYAPGYAKGLYSIGEEWWENHIVQGIPPEPDGSKAWDAYVKRQWPRHVGDDRPFAGPEADALALRFLELQRVEKAAAKDRKQVRQELERIVGELPGLIGPTWKLSWRSGKPETEVDWEGLAKSLGVSLEMIEAFTHEKPTGRRFVLTGSEP